MILWWRDLWNAVKFGWTSGVGCYRHSRACRAQGTAIVSRFSESRPKVGGRT